VKNQTFEFLPKEAANHAAQALYGLYAFILRRANDIEQWNEVTDLILETLRTVEDQSDQENLDSYVALRELFFQAYSKLNFPFFLNDKDRIWKLFVERFHLSTGQMRMSISDLYECCDYQKLAQSMSRSEIYLRRLPPSSEIVLMPTNGGARAEIVIPLRLLVLDMILMLIHARNEHFKIQEAWLNQQEKGVFHLDPNGRLDTYARQVLILATTICDAVLTEYGYIVEYLAKKAIQKEQFEDLKRLHKKGVYERLQKIPLLWTSILGTKQSDKDDVFNDMTGLITIRNKLIHPDGGINGWFAFQISPMYGNGWKFSERLHTYIQEFKGSFARYNVGYEYATCLFCVDTTIAIINEIHRLVFMGDTHAYWLDIPMKEVERVDLDAVIRLEKALQI